MVGGWSTSMILIEVSQTCVKEDLNLLDKTRLEFLMLVNTNFMKAETAGSIHENFVYQPKELDIKNSAPKPHQKYFLIKIFHNKNFNFMGLAN